MFIHVEMGVHWCCGGAVGLVRCYVTVLFLIMVVDLVVRSCCWILPV